MTENKLIASEESIRNKIFAIRNVQVMLDSDLAVLYNVDIKRLNEQVKRNKERFPKNFMFQLTDTEYNSLRSQFATLEKGRGIHRKYLPFVFTEQGVAMLSGILRSDTAIKASIHIINAFVAMRKFISKNAELFGRLDSVERKQLEFQLKTDKSFEKVFEAIEDKTTKKKQGIFFDGQIFDAYKFVSDLVREAKDSIYLIDNYVDDSVLTILSKCQKKVSIVVYTSNISKQLRLDIERYNSQYTPIILKEFNISHDRFMIIDKTEVYHIGASLKDLGKKWFAFSKISEDSLKLLDRLKDEK